MTYLFVPDWRTLRKRVRKGGGSYAGLTSAGGTSRSAALRDHEREWGRAHAILIDVLTQALRDDESAAEKRRVLALAGGEWQEHEIAQLTSFLHERPAKSWQQADECVMHLAAQLHRDPQAVRDKATELGLGAAVDYRFAKTIKQARGGDSD